MFAYIDESGHTGKNIFDEAQPWFYYTCALAKEDIDIALKTEFSEMCKKLGVAELHANDLGIEKLKLILPDIQHLVKKHSIRFVFTQVEKKWFALCKFFDAVFDSGENVAAPWTLYNVPGLRHVMLFKIEYIMTQENIQSFWDAILQRDTSIAQSTLQDVLSDALKRVESLPDKRSKEIITDAFQWAIKYPDEFMLNFEKKKEVNLHLPNYPIFSVICKEIYKQSEHWNLPVKIIKHDRQQQILGQLRKSFETSFNCDFKKLDFLGQDLSFGGLKGADFVSINAQESCGIQLVDIVLWLSKKIHEDNRISSDPVVEEFMKRISRNRNEVFEISKHKSDEIGQSLIPLMEHHFSQEQLAKGQEIVNLGESKRKENMAEYERKRAQK